MRLRAYTDLRDAAGVLNLGEQTEVTVPIRAPSEVAATDDEKFPAFAVEGKTIELELELFDADVGLSLVDMSAIVEETGDLMEDRSTTE